MDRFIYDSKEFWEDLEGSPHHLGEVRFLRSIARPGMRAIDAGANVGVTAVALAKHVAEKGHVYAFEPVPEFYAALNENLSRNRVENVSTHRLALSNHTGRIRFYKHGGGSGIAKVDQAEPIWVEATTLAEFLPPGVNGRIDLLNLDCEGSELLVFRGGRTILEKHAPQIFCEIHHGYLKDLAQSPKAVVDFLEEIGYDVRPLQMEDLGAKTTLEKCSHIYAARPRGRAQSGRRRKERARGRHAPAPSLPASSAGQTLR
jgi:FkbM family methyltransferase